MSKKRNYRLIIIIILILVSVSISVAFAVLNQSLTITGNARIQNGTWNIAFANLNSTTIGNGEDDSSQIVGNTTINISAILKTPGDRVSYTFNVLNNGTIDAKLYDIIFNGAFNEFPDIKVSLNYADDFDYGNNELQINDTLLKETSRPLKLDIWFDSEATHIESEDRTLSFTINLVYIQDN